MKRPARPITAKYLMNAATFYLERYPSTAEGLRRVLNRRVAKAKMAEAPVMENVEQAIAGSSTRATRQKLTFAGVDGDTLDRAMDALDEELDTDPAKREWQAAVALARRRRLGPFRPDKDRKDKRLRDLAAMARAGFAYDVAKKVIDAATPDALDEE